MADVYRWYYSVDGGESYTLLAATDRQSAIEEVPEWCIRFKICEASKYSTEDIKISGNRFLEDLYNQYDWGDPDSNDSPFDCTEEQAEDLSRMLTITYRVWCDKHGTHPDSWAFKDTRNEEEITMPHPNGSKT